MKCRECGAEVKWDDKFCQGCGMRLDSDTHTTAEQQNAKRAEQKSLVMNALNNTFSSPRFLTACIFLSVALAVQLFQLKDFLKLGEGTAYVLLIHVMPILTLIFLWITYSSARRQSLNYEFTSIKALNVLAKIQNVVGYATAIGFLVLYIYSYAGTNSIENGTVEAVERATESVGSMTKIFLVIVLCGSVYNILVFFGSIYLSAMLFFSYSESVSLSALERGDTLEALTWVVIFTFIIMMVITLFFTRSFKSTTESVIMCAETGRPYYGNFLLAEVWLYIVAGVVILCAFASDVLFVAGYAGFMISMGLTIRKLDYELKRTRQ